MEHDAVKKALVDVAVGVDKGHALEEGMDAETDEQPGDGMHCPGVAMAGVWQVGVVVLVGFGLLFAAGAVVVAMLHAAGDLLKEQLDEESHHDRGGNFEVDAGGDETVGVVAEEDVRHKVDETGCKQERTTKDGDGGGESCSDMFAAGDQSHPADDADDDEDVG